jgi:hypothetical protein
VDRPRRQRVPHPSEGQQFARYRSYLSEVCLDYNNSDYCNGDGIPIARYTLTLWLNELIRAFGGRRSGRMVSAERPIVGPPHAIGTHAIGTHAIGTHAIGRRRAGAPLAANGRAPVLLACLPVQR